jgi:hypothetical protein
MFGLWAAEKLGLSGIAAENYAKELVAADLAQTGDNDIFRKLEQDFEAAGVAFDKGAARQKLDEFMSEALLQLKEKR